MRHEVTSYAVIRVVEEYFHSDAKPIGKGPPCFPSLITRGYGSIQSKTELRGIMPRIRD
jgi:hypothetical protein